MVGYTWREVNNMKKMMSIILVCIIILSCTSVLASTCSYCGYYGREVCQGDSLWTTWCPGCGDETCIAATHHFQCDNMLCLANYYQGNHKCYCTKYFCGYVCPY